MPSYLDFNSTKRLRDELLAKTLQAPNGPQTYNTSNYSIQNTRSLANRNLGDVTLNDETSREAQIVSNEGNNRFGPENSEYEILENTRTLVDVSGNVGLYPYFPIADGILGRSLIGALNSSNYEFESRLAQFANYHLTESPDGPVQSRIRQNLKTATEGRARILDAVNGNLSSAINIVRGRERLIEKNYKITVARTIPGKAIDFLQTVSGIEFPWSEIPGDYLTNPANPVVNRPVPKSEFGKIFQDATGVLGSLLGIQRRPTKSRKPSDLMIEYLSDGQKDILFDNLSFSTYAPNYTTRARSQNTSKLFNFVDSVATGINKILGREAPEGKAYIGDDRGDDVKNILEDFNQNKVLSPYYLSLKFDSVATELFSNETNISERGSIPGKLTWFSRNSKSKLGFHNEEYSTERGKLEDSLSTRFEFRDDSILGKTQQLLDSLPKNGGESRSHVANVIDQTSRIFREGTKFISRGSAIKYVNKATGTEDGTEYCRVWTKDRAYMNYSDTMKKTGTIRKINDSVLSTPWNLNIGPMSNGNNSFVGSTNIDGIEGKAKKYMFSIENLAWKTSNKFGYTVNDLPVCERGQNGGRVMWFPPYDLKVNENNTANWDKNSFLGRPEPIYTYQNTERTGTISFKVIVDHPSILNLLIKEISDEEAENFLNSFFAGCYDVDFYTLVRKYITLDPSDIELIISYLEYYRDNKREDVTTSINFNRVSGKSVVAPGKEVPIESEVTPGGTDETLVKLFVDNEIYFPNDIPLPRNDIYVDIKSASYDSIYNSYIADKENFKNQLASGLNTILTVNNKDNKADRLVIFGSEDPTSGGTISVQTLINDKKDLIEKAFNQLQTNFGVISGATTTLKSELEKNNVKDIMIKIESSTSFVADDTYNIKLSHRRSDSLIKYIFKSIAKTPTNIPTYKWANTIEDLNKNSDKTIQNVKIPLKELGYGEDNEGSIVIDFVNKGEDSTGSGSPEYDCHNKEIKNKTGLKKYAPITFYCRSAKVDISYKQKNKTDPDTKPATKFIPGEVTVIPGRTDITTNTTSKKKRPPLDVVKKLIMKALSECFYFKKLEETDPVVFGSLKEKLRYFHPAFHSMTPEGLNARLTFLHQCIRPGDTIPVKKLGTDISGTVVDARNTTFGPPPVCVLRIGDFYHSKIVITNMNITYENSTWDLNPEGIGVQPMVADVTLQVNFIGGQGIKEPVAKLQNALSSNFFANTEVYDYRADSTVDQKELQKFNIDFLEKLTGGVKTDDIRKIPTSDKTKTDGKWIGSQNGTKMSYKEVIEGLIKGTNEYFNTFKNTYNTLTKTYGKEILPLFISPTYRTVNQLDVQTDISSTIQVNLLGQYKNLVDFANLYERLAKPLLEKANSSDHNSVLDLDLNANSQEKYQRSRDIIDTYIKGAVTEFLNKIRDEKSIKQLEDNRNKLIDLVDRVNFIIKTNGKDGRFDKKETTVASLTNFDASKFYDQYDEAINLIKDKHSIFTTNLDTTINFNLPVIDDVTYKKILAFVIKDNVAVIKKLYENSADEKFFDKNAVNKIERRLEKFIKKNISDYDEKKFKFKEAKLKKEIKPVDFTLTGTLSGQESELLDKVHSIDSKSDGVKLNFLKPGK